MSNPPRELTDDQKRDKTYVENYSSAFADAMLVLLYGPGAEGVPHD